MYKRASQGWLKHLDFIIVDELCLQIAFVLAYLIRQRAFPPYVVPLYRSIGITFVMLDLLVPVMLDTMHNVMKRGYYKEFRQTVIQSTVVFLLTVLWMFTLQTSDAYSRIIVFLTYLFHIAIGYGGRVLWKRFLNRHGAVDSGKQAMLAVLEPDNAEQMIQRLTSNPLDGYHIVGVVLINNPDSKTEVDGVPVVCSFEEAAGYICREWIDSVFISSNGVTPEVREFMGRCAEMAVVMHYHVPSIGQDGNKQFVEKIGGSTVLTSSNNYVKPGQLLIKRLIDLIGGLVGSLFALIIMAIVGPIIKKASPGPILYRSERIGQNGRRFIVNKFGTVGVNKNKALIAV